MYNKFLLLVFFSACCFLLQAQDNETPNFWTPSTDQQYRSNSYQREIVPAAYVTFDLDYKAFEKQLSEALPNTYTNRSNQKTTVYLPNPAGEMEEYTVWRDNLLPKELNERYPEISVFAGYCNDNPHKTVRFDFTDKGFRAMSYGLNQSTYYIDPIAKGIKSTVISYYKKDHTSKPAFECLVEDVIEEKEHTHDHAPQRIAGDCDLHTFELALACTGEYAAFHGGTKTAVMAEYVTSINRINGLFETELGIRLILIPNTDELIFLNANTDPYTNDDGAAMLNQNQNTCDNIIGSSNYDIGHVYSTGGGGIAQLFSPCNGGKARGVTGLPNPVGDPFYIDYVAHELGHQFGATHTYNNSCGGQRSTSASYEPGSGSTIMAYAGICPPNVQFFSDSYFHAISLEQIGLFLESSNCEDITTSGSDRPIIAPLQNYNIPIGTPFELTASATVSDGSALTYCWEQWDREVANMPPESNATEGPMFRSLTPVASPSRIFPSINFLTLNLDNQWEVLPEATRALNFRVSVRASGGGTAGCIEEADLRLNSTTSSGPFLVLAPNTNLDWVVGNTESVIWDVANTTAPPVSCQNVNILLSTDGGFTYPITVVENTPNDGQADVMVPNFPGFETRVRVQAADNVFFDISNENFSIVEPVVPTFTLNAQPNEQTVCGSNADVVSYDINSTALSGFNNSVQYTASGLPNGVSANFDNNNSVPNSTVTLNLDGLENVSSGSYTFTVQGNGGGQSDDVDLTINVVDNAPQATNLLLPENAAADIEPSSAFSWTQVDFADGYIIEISPEANFSNIVYSTTVAASSAVPEGLTPSTVYYWRVRATNLCGEGPASPIFRFRTGTISCETYTNDNGTSISTTAGTINSTINVPNAGSIESVSLSTIILHTYIGDLDATLISPAGNSLSIFDRPGLPNIDDFGCPNDNIRATFDDNANNSAADFEDTCGGGQFTIDDDYQPIDPFNNLAGENATGNWVLEITDNFDQDGGSLDIWSLEICTSSGSSSAPILVNNNVLSVIRSNSADITSNELSFSGMGNSDNVNFTLITLPSQGTLLRNGTLLQVGDKFTQTEINNATIAYNHNGSADMTDSFIFDVEEVNGGWLPNNTFQIQIVDQSFTAIATQNSSILCFGSNEGSISIEVDGGNSPFMYSLDGANFQADNTFSGLTAGSYTFTVLDDALNIVSTNTLTLDEPDQLMINAAVNENTVTLTATGGTGNLEYSLDNNSYQTSNVFDNLANGNYIFYVRDANDCVTNTETVSVLVNTLSLTANITSELNCHDGTDAQITVSVAGGTAPYTYTLNGQAPSTSNIFSNLGAGSYTVVVQDANQFTATSNSVSISNPTEVMISAVVDRNNISLSATGGTGVYQYSLNNQNDFQVNPNYEGLVNGDYMVFVIDQNGCVDDIIVSIDYEAVTLSTSIVFPVLCNGGMDAIVEVNVSSGVGPFQYALDNGAFQSSNIFENLGAGNYTFRVLDSFSDETSIDLTLDDPTALSLSIDSDQGTVNLQGIGGTPPYVYAVDDFMFQPNGLFENLTEGQHEAAIIDANECIITMTFTTSINDLVASATQLTEILCAGDQTSSIVVDVTDGTEPYAYSIDGNIFQDENIFENLGAGQYTISIIDAEDFTTSTNIIISEPDAIDLDIELVQNNVTINATGGTAPYEYRIAGQNYQADKTFDNLATGNFDFEVRDANGCLANISTSITYELLSLEAELISGLACAGDENASIITNASGGIAPYEYSINGGAFQASANFTNLSAGVYTITVRDSDGLEVESNNIEIIEPEAISLSVMTSGINTSIMAMGGTGNLSYSIDGQDYQDSNTFSRLSDGAYTAYVQDENGCIETSDFSINTVSDLIVLASVSKLISCFDAADGAIVVETSGGTNPKEYSLDGENFQTSNFFENLPAGNYTITVRDADGTIVVSNVVTLDNPDALSATLEINQNSLTVNASGGTGNYTYSIDGINYQDSNQFIQLINGNYIAYIQDENECLYTENFSIDFDELFADFEISGENLCARDMDVSITILASGGEAPYSYTISGGVSPQNSNVFLGLGAGTYDFIIRDATGSMFLINDVEVTDPSPLSLVSQVDGNQVRLTAQGGTAPYQFSVDGTNYQDNDTFENLANDEFTGFVQDANGCISETSFSVNVILPLSIVLDAIEILDCTGETAGSISATAMGGTAPYLFSLDNGPFTAQNVFENLPPAQYRVTVQDALMNEVSSLANLTAPDPLEMEVVITDGSVEVIVTGGRAPYAYSIDGGQAFSNSQFFTDLETGEYNILVEDANQCAIEQRITISVLSVSPINHSLILDLAPNPASDITYLSIESQSYQEIRISLIDILGRTVRTYESNSSLGSDQFPIDVSSIVSGTYLIRMDLDGQVAIRKLIVE